MLNEGYWIETKSSQTNRLCHHRCLILKFKFYDLLESDL